MIDAHGGPDLAARLHAALGPRHDVAAVATVSALRSRRSPLLRSAPQEPWTVHDGRRITWHNGGTGGFRSWIGVDLAQRTGVVLLTARAVTVDASGFRMLAALSGPRP